jgi:hypothetical protein
MVCAAEQFAVDAGRAPEGVGQAHLADQMADLGAVGTENLIGMY